MMSTPAGLLDNLQGRNNGRTITLEPDGVGPRVTQADLLFMSGGNCPNPEAVVITLGRLNIEDPEDFPGVRYRLRAEITWGTGQAENKVVMDFHHGTRLTLDAQTLQIKALYLLDTATDGPRVKLTASVMYGAFGSELTTLTLDRTTIAAASSSAFIDIPQFARYMTLFPGGALTVEPSVAFSADKATGQILVAQPVMTKFEIPNGMESFSIGNNDPAQQIFTPVFDLVI